MPESPLHDSVEAQARAWVAGDLATFASFATPRAVVDLRDGDLRGARAFEVVACHESGSTGTSRVRYAGRAQVVIEQRWQRIDGLWKVVHAEVRETQPLPWWRRLIRRGASAADRAAP